MAFTCPRCGRTSHNPNDEREGYCGACSDWTGRPSVPRDTRPEPTKERDERGT